MPPAHCCLRVPAGQRQSPVHQDHLSTMRESVCRVEKITHDKTKMPWVTTKTWCSQTNKPNPSNDGLTIHIATEDIKERNAITSRTHTTIALEHAIEKTARAVTKFYFRPGVLIGLHISSSSTWQCCHHHVTDEETEAQRVKCKFQGSLDTLRRVCVLGSQLWLTLCDPMDYSPSCSSFHRILQAITLEWVAMPSSRGSYVKEQNVTLQKMR